MAFCDVTRLVLHVGLLVSQPLSPPNPRGMDMPPFQMRLPLHQRRRRVWVRIRVRVRVEIAPAPAEEAGLG